MEGEFLFSSVESSIGIEKFMLTSKMLTTPSGNILLVSASDSDLGEVLIRTH